MDEIDTRASLDRLVDFVLMLEQAFADWAASPRTAVSFHAEGWPDADGRCQPELARYAVLMAIESKALLNATDVIAAGLSLLLGPKGRAQERRDAAAIRRAGSVPLTVALLAPGCGDDVEALVTTVAVAPRTLH